VWRRPVPRCKIVRPILEQSKVAERTTVERALVWFRRDLRAEDNAALAHALRAARSVSCVFVFDRNLLDHLPRADRRVEFIRESVAALDEALTKLGGGIIVLHGDPVEAIPQLARELGVSAVYANHDDDPYARARDRRVRDILDADGIDWRTRKDHVVFERDEILTASGTPCVVFTPYKNAWLARLSPDDLAPHSVAPHAAPDAREPRFRRNEHTRARGAGRRGGEAGARGVLAAYRPLRRDARLSGVGWT
jgi:deoxyribodipyrimidine photo-lyase